MLVDYELSPEHQYPSAIIETLAAYHHLVNELKIPESRICLAGDSAGGNIAAALMLHLARPNPNITVPAAHGPTPGQPGSALLISPFISLVSSLPSRQANIDFDCTSLAPWNTLTGEQTSTLPSATLARWTT